VFKLSVSYVRVGFTNIIHVFVSLFLSDMFIMGNWTLSNHYFSFVFIFYFLYHCWF